jgi:ABC-type transport system involved in multi-copper enzyme maturation permease subunit
VTSLTAQPGETAPAQRTRAVPPVTRRPGFAGTLRSELTKIRSVRSTYFTLIAFFVAGVAFSIAATAGNAANWSHLSPGQVASFDSTATSLNGALYLGELIIVVIGAMVITSEYGTRMIGASLTAMPRRGVLYAAKAAVLTSMTLVVALITSFVSFFAGQAILGPKHAGASIASPGALRAVLLSAVFVTCCALLAFGLGAIIRHTAGAITTLFGVFFLIPGLAHALPNSWFFEIARWLPGGDALGPINATKPLGQPYLYGPYGQLAVFAGYAVIAVVAGAMLFRRRDA